jgi:methionine-rich copper-binding protein CopC
MAQKLLNLGAALAALFASSCSPSLVAPPQLVASWPMSGARLSRTHHTFELTFNEPLESSSTSASVSRATDGATMTTSVSVDPANPRRLTVRLMDPAVGDYQLHWHAVAAPGATESSGSNDGDQSFLIQEGTPAPPRVDVSPASVEVGERMELVGKGFTPGSTLHVVMGDDAQPVATADADQRGQFNIEAKLPDTVPYGLQPITVLDTNGAEAMASIQVKWGGWPPVVPIDTGQPGPAPGEVTFTMSLRNRSDYVLEHVEAVMQDPEGATLVGTQPAGAERQDDTVTWQIPVMQRGVAGPYQATYRVNSAVVSHSWLHFRHRRPRGCVGVDCLPAFVSDSTANSERVGPAE